MDDKVMRNLQVYIGKRSKGQSDQEVIAHIEKINSKENITRNEWENLLFPVCANCDLVIFEYILKQLPELSNPRQFILHTLNFRNTAAGYEKKQSSMVERLLAYVSMEDRQQVLNDALVSAVWFGEFESVKYLIQQGADLTYQSNGRSMLELAQNAVAKFGDKRTEELILAN